MAARGGEHLDAVSGEHLGGGDAAQVAPVVAVGGPHEGGVAVAEVLARKQPRAVGEDDVVSCEAFLHRGGGGDDEHGAGTELEEQNWTVFLGDFF